MRRRFRERYQDDADLNITPFLNLMIVLVPVLLMTMVFSRITVLGLTLPDAVSNPETPEEDQHLELVVREDKLEVYYPRGYLLKTIPNIPLADLADEESMDGGAADSLAPALGHDFDLLANVLQEVKRLLKDKDIDKRDITILSEADTDYQTIVSLMDASRSFKAVVAGSVVDAELFPEISLGDAPVIESGEVALQ